MSRIVAVDGPIGGLQVGSTVEAQYDVPEDAWYFVENGSAHMPFCVLQEIALHPEHLANWRAVHTNGTDAPLMTPPDRIDPSALGALGYRKPGAVMLALRNEAVGRETFDRAMREYARRWAFKHPTPADFFRTVEDVSGQDLSWFWNGFFYTTDQLDLGIAGVETKEVEGRRVATVTITRGSSIVFPPSVRLRLADGSTQDARFPVQLWSTCGRQSCDRVQASVVVRSKR
jgi:hypothetical protein